MKKIKIEQMATADLNELYSDIADVLRSRKGGTTPNTCGAWTPAWPIFECLKELEGQSNELREILNYTSGIVTSLSEFQKSDVLRLYEQGLLSSRKYLELTTLLTEARSWFTTLPERFLPTTSTPSE